MRRHSLIRGLVEPNDGLRCVLQYPLAFGVHRTEVRLSVGIALICRLAEPIDGLCQVLLNPFAVRTSGRG